jgi:hypothetical protein
LSGGLTGIIANDNASGQAIVTIASSDAGFETRRCGTWSPIPAAGHPATTFGNGTWAVGTEIAPGTYSTQGGTGCYWARLSGFTGNATSIIANTNATGPTTVTIDPSDVGFDTHSCGTWTLQS